MRLLRWVASSASAFCNCSVIRQIIVKYLQLERAAIHLCRESARQSLLVSPAEESPGSTGQGAR